MKKILTESQLENLIESIINEIMTAGIPAAGYNTQLQKVYGGVFPEEEPLFNTKTLEENEVDTPVKPKVKPGVSPVRKPSRREQPFNPPRPKQDPRPKAKDPNLDKLVSRFQKLKKR